MIEIFYRKAAGKAKKTHECCITLQKAPGMALTKQYEFGLLAQLFAVPLVSIALSLLVVGSWLDARLALAIPSACWVLAFSSVLPRAWPDRKGYFSFRGIVIIPALFIAGAFAFAFAVVLLFVLINSKMSRQPPQQPNKPGPAWDLSQDVPTAQMLCVVAPIGAWLFTVVVPAAMCVLGYRYDAGELATPTSQEKQMALLQLRAVEAQQEADTSEVSSAQALLTSKSLPTKSAHLPLFADQSKTPIVLRTASVPESAVRSAPTFRAGLAALIVIHSIGLGSSLVGGIHLPGVGVPRVIRSHPEDDTMTALFLPQIAHLAVFVVPVVMLMAAECVKQGGARQLWTYCERWSTPDEEESHEQLALRPSLDGRVDEQQPLLRTNRASD